MMLLRPPGVYPPQGDSALLARALIEELSARRAPGRAEVLELGTGSGAVAVVAAGMGARVTAVDVSWLALATAWINSRLRRRRVHLRHGDLGAPVRGRRFDLVVSNPPYVPARSAGAPGHGPERAWDAGPDGRLLLDRICRQAAGLLGPGGAVLLVQSSLAAPAATLDALAAAGLRPRIVARRRQPFGPVMSARAAWFEQQGLIPRGVRDEELVVIRGARPA
ncbi:HemK2/MTQ2 family protein methyltransferase [Kitasatospora sp. NPDC094015]|uniref:HemK2/MTQ2 family protein methyltransferase n=1 Tax=Kitasatospora sp. NPDC094015 TaxID=3155205 RepID=UPI003333EEAE